MAEAKDKPYACRPRRALRVRFQAYMARSGQNANRAILSLMAAGLDALGEPPAADAPVPARFCGNCRWAAQTTWAQGVAREVQCRRWPPARDEFPSVQRDTWCGEFKVKD